MEDRLLVAYFRDDTFAWCQPSQLKPFEENFEEMSRQSNSKSFVYAVQRATEIARLLEVEMTCYCVTKENRNGLDRPLVANAEIQNGVLVPECRIGNVSNILSEPVDLLAEMKTYCTDYFHTQCAWAWGVKEPNRNQFQASKTI